MSGISGMGTTYNLPNYVGELHAASPEDTPFLSSIGGLTGGESVNSVIFEWQGYDLRDAEDDRQRKEGADAQTAGARVRFNESNVVEIHQETVDISYTKQAATGQRGTEDTAVQVGTTLIPANELAWQVEQQLKQIARDIEKTFITGTYARPSTNSNPRKTRGLLQAISTNTDTVSLGDLDADAVLDLFQKVWENGGIQEAETRTVIVNATLKRALTKMFITESNYQEQSRNVGGVNLQTFETDFGRANIMLNRYMPADKLAVVSLEQCAPAYLEIPGKGHFFAEPLAKIGASDRVQLYGEIGLKYGNEKAHGVLTVTGMDDSSSSS